MGKPWSYDPACETLARHFMPEPMHEYDVNELAQHIQDQIEAWLNREPADPPGFEAGFVENH